MKPLATKKKEHTMRRIAATGVLLLAIVSLAFGQIESSGPKKGSNDEQAIRQVLEEYREAILKNDVSAMDRIEAADFTLTIPSGLYREKTQQLAQAPSNQFEFIIWDDIKVRIYGDTAVVTFHVLRKAKPTAEEQLRVLAVYVKQKGQWKVVAQQGTRIAG
jgi:ketosteroid isomerase-like protein